MPAVSITSFRLHGSITWTRTSISSSRAPRRGRAGRPTNINPAGKSRPWPASRGRLYDGQASVAQTLLLELKRLVPTLVIKRSGRCPGHLAELLGMRGRLVAGGGAWILPHLDHCEMVGPGLLLIDVIAQVAFVLAGRIGQGLKRGDAVVLFRGDDVDM